MTSNLGNLRRDAGYKSARAFADHIGVPLPTYARYESKPEKIPLAAAWLLADMFHCSIDAIVGRKELDIEGLKGPVQKQYDALSDEGASLMDEFFAFVAERENSTARHRSFYRERMYDALAYQYERTMLTVASDDDALVFSVSSDRRRGAFERFVREQVAKEHEKEEASTENLAARDEVTIAEIIAAYDRIHDGYNMQKEDGCA